MTQQAQIPPPAQMMQMITDFWTSCCIYTAAKLNIADIIAEKPQTAAQLAEATHCHASSLYRVVRALASAGIFNENEKGEFSNTALGETLRSDVPGSMKAMAIAQLGDHFNAWGNLLYSVKTGNIAFDYVEGMSIWKYYETNPEDGLNFMKAMTGMTGAAIMNVLPAYDFSAFKTITDVGGGNGAMLMAILKQYPNAKGIVFDEEYLADETKKSIIQNNLQNRCEVKSGSFFDGIPEGSDAYLMKMVLHDWNDEKSLQILRNCHKAMQPEGKLLVIEAMLTEGNAPHPGKFLDINMLAVTGGKERTEKEFSALFYKAGLKLVNITPTHSPMFSVIEVQKK